MDPSPVELHHVATTALPGAALFHPAGGAWLPDGSLVVADEFGHRLHWIDPTSGELRETTGEQGSGPGQFWYPTGLALQGERIFVCDSWNHRLQWLDLTTREWGAHGRLGGGPDEWYEPVQALALGGERLLVVDRGNHRLVLLEGHPPRTVAVLGGAGQFDLPSQAAALEDGTVVVLDRHGRRLQRWRTDPPERMDEVEADLGSDVASVQAWRGMLLWSAEREPLLRCTTPLGIPLFELRVPDAERGGLLLSRAEELLLLLPPRLLRVELRCASLVEAVAAMQEQIPCALLPLLHEELGDRLPPAVQARLIERLEQADPLPLERMRRVLAVHPDRERLWRRSAEEDSYPAQQAAALLELQGLAEVLRAQAVLLGRQPDVQAATDERSQAVATQSKLLALEQQIAGRAGGACSLSHQASLLARLASPHAAARTEQLVADAGALQAALTEHLRWLAGHLEACWRELPDREWMGFDAVWEVLWHALGVSGTLLVLSEDCTAALELLRRPQPDDPARLAALRAAWPIDSAVHQPALRRGGALSGLPLAEPAAPTIGLDQAMSPVSLLRTARGFLVADGVTHLIEYDESGHILRKLSPEQLGCRSTGRLFEADGTLYLCDYYGGRVHRLHPDTWRAEPLEGIELERADSYQRDSTGRQLVADSAAGRCQVFAPDGSPLAAFEVERRPSRWLTACFAAEPGVAFVQDPHTRTVWRWDWQADTREPWFAGETFVCDAPLRIDARGNMLLPDFGYLIVADPQGRLIGRHRIGPGQQARLTDLLLEQDEQGQRIAVLLRPPAQIQFIRLASL